LAFVNGILDDLVLAGRSIRRARGFSVAIMVTIGIGAGANLAVLTVLDRVLFRPPRGVEAPQMLRRLWVTQQVWGQPSATGSVFSFPDFQDFRARAAELARVEAIVTDDRTLSESGRRVAASYVTGGFLNLAGAHAHRGRFFGTESDSGSVTEYEVVLSFHLWMSQFGGDSAVIGLPLRLDEVPVRVVGVAAPGFQGVGLDATDLWLPMVARGVDAASVRLNRDAQWLQVIVRLANSASEKLLEGRLTTEYRRVHRGDAWADPRARVLVGSIMAARQPGALLPLEERNLSLATRLAVISLAMLVVAIGNCAALMLLRAIRQRREVGIRIALGLSRARLLRQLALELLLLGACATVVAVVLAMWGSRTLQSGLLSTVSAAPLALNTSGLAAIALTALVSTLVAGLAAVLLLLHTSATTVSSSEAVSPSRTDARIRSAAIVGQTAVSVALLALAATFSLSSRRAVRANSVYDGDRLIAIVSRSVRPDDIARLLAAVRTVPFVEASANAIADVQPGRSIMRVQARAGGASGQPMPISFNAVDSAFFRTTGLVANRGRTFEPADRSSPVIVVTNAAAAALWPREEPLGQCAFLFDATCWRVVGVVSDVRWNLGLPPVAHVYIPLTRAPGQVGRVVLVRTRGAATAAQMAELERVASAGNTGNIVSIYRVSDRFERQIRPLRTASTLLSFYAVLVLCTAVVGIYGRVSFEMVQRSRELGLRAALGASPTSLMLLLFETGMSLVAIGLAAGAVLSATVGGLAARFLFDTSAQDPFVIGAVVAALFVASVAATFSAAWPALSAAPADALRMT